MEMPVPSGDHQLDSAREVTIAFWIAACSSATIHLDHGKMMVFDAPAGPEGRYVPHARRSR